MSQTEVFPQGEPPPLEWTRSAQVGDLMVALAKARAKFKPIVKDAFNPHFGRRYASLDSLFDSTSPALCEFGLVLYHQTIEDHERQVAGVRGYLHLGEQFISAQCLMPVERWGPQGIGGGQTYARRYTSQALLGVAAEEDDDAESATDRDKPTRAKSAAPKEIDRTEYQCSHQGCGVISTGVKTFPSNRENFSFHPAVKVKDPMFRCPACGQFTPARSPRQPGEEPDEDKMPAAFYGKGESGGPADQSETTPSKTGEVGQ